MPYGSPTDPVGGTVITVAYAVANLLDPIRALRTFTGGSDPPGSNYWLRSDSVSAVSWVARGAEVLSALGFTPVNKAGDTMTNTLTMAANAANAPAGGIILLSEVAAHGGTWIVEPLNNTFVIARAGAGSFLTLSATGAISAPSATLTGALTSGSVSTGAVTGTTINGTTDVQKNGASVVARANHTGTQAPSTISPQGAGSGLDADNLDGTTWHAGLTAENTAGQTFQTTFTDVSTCSVTLDRAGTWLILGTSNVTTHSSNGVHELRIVVNGVAQTPVGQAPGGTTFGPMVVSTFAHLSASNGHIAKLQMRVVSGGGVGTLHNARIVAIWLAP